MKKPSLARLIVTDFAASVLTALSIGIATSVALAGAVLLIAHQGETTPVSVSDREAP